MTARAGRGAGGLLRAAPALTVGAFLLPIAAGLAGTLLPAFGYLPAIGGDALGLDGFRRLVAYPGFASSVAVTLTTGIATPLLAVAIALALCACAHGRPWQRKLSAWLAPVLATPHSALAIGLAFLLAPSGWIARLLSPWLTGWTLPPDVATVGDPAGIALVLGLLVKEVPYLVLMIVGALNQVPAREHVVVARALGYSRTQAWLKVVLPQVYPQIRLPVYAVIAFSLSVVDVALILGPTNPPTLAVLAVRWFTDADIDFYFQAAAAATLLLAIVIAAIAGWYGLELVVIGAGRRWIAQGARDGALAAGARAGAAGFCALSAAAAAALAGMVLWSFAAQWRFPAALPQAWSLANWMRRLDGLAGPALTTLAVGVLATAIALALVIGCLENESRSRHRAGPRALWLLYLPLLVPQVAFLFGAQVLLVRLGFDGALAAVVWAHLVFVLPYLFLSLADPWRSFDPRYARSAASLGASPARVLFAVKLPILLKPVLIACAVAFAVSVGQYLATLFAGNGRVATLTTEAVTLAAGADRRVIGAYAVAQAAFPLLAYVAAVAIPALLYANRRGLGGRG
ncbi:MAG: ABC transporter permease subunit [Burkholderiales bacterium]|nr:ABC transporter permease subunit [Burkholderiales bacterium]